MRNYIDLLTHFNQFRSYLENNIGSVDIFVATWNQRNTDFSWSAAHGDTGINHHNSIDANIISKNLNTPTENIIVYNYAFFDSLYSPLRYNLFTNKSYNWDSRGIHNNIIHSAKMLFLIYQANMLKTQQEFVQQKPYDMVIRSRPDMFYEIDRYRNIPFSSMENQSLYINQKINHTYNDRFAFGSSDVMDKYSAALYRMACSYDANIFGDPETLLYHSINNLLQNISIIHINEPGLLMSEITNQLR